MDTAAATEIFNAAADKARAEGRADDLAKIELVREYLTNPEFRAALAAHLFEAAK